MGSTADPRPTNYLDLFQDPSANPFGLDAARRRGAYKGIYEKFTSEGPSPALPPATLLEHVLNLFEAQAVGGIGIFVNDINAIPRLRVIHGIRKYPGSLLTPSQNSNKAFGYLDDVISGRGELVRVTTTMFSLTSTTRVHTVQQHQMVLEANPQTEFTGPLTEADPNTEELKCRHTFFLPFELVPLVMGQNLSPREAFFIIHPWLQAQGWDADAKPLVDALRVAGTNVLRATTTGNPAEPVCEIAANEPGPLFRAEAELTVYMEQKVLHRDLSGLLNIPSHIGPEAAALTAAVSTLTDNQLKMNEANERRRAEESKPASMEDVFGSLNITRLKSLCRTDQEGELPPIYQGWTGKKKGEKLHALFQNYVDQSARELGLQPPFVPTSVLKTFQAFRFYGIDECNLGDGILPMAFSPPGGSPTARKRQMEDAATAMAYDTLMGTEGNSINLADARTLGKAQGYIPIDWTEAILQAEGYLPVLATVVGVEHAIVRSYLEGLNRLKRIQLALRYALIDECRDRLAPAIIVYYFQVRVRCWLEEQWDSHAVVEVPSFTRELRLFKLSKNLSWLPVVTDIPALKGLKLSPANNSASTAKSSGRAGTTGSNGNRTTPNSKGGSTPSSNTTQQRVENPKQDPRLSAADGELGARIKSWKISKAMGAMKDKGKGPCNRSDGKEMCHSWRAKGFCYDGCKLSYDHKESNPEDSDKFWEWCQEAYGPQ